MLDQDDRAALAKLLGAKPAEILDAVETDAGVVVTTHDGVHSLVRPDHGIVSPYQWAGRPPVAANPARAVEEVPPIPLPTVGEIYTDEHEQALLDWLLDQGYAPSVDEPPTTPDTGDEPAQEAADDADGADGAEGAEGADGAGASGAGTDEDTLPGGSIADVLAWVGDDKKRAKQALAAEQVTERPRVGLVAKLQTLSEDGGSTA